MSERYDHLKFFIKLGHICFSKQFHADHFYFLKTFLWKCGHNDLGFQPSKISGNDYWYSSPLRNEHTPSFKVNRRLNKWFDHGLGKGGNLVDFGILYYNCSMGELLQKSGSDTPALDEI